MARILKIINGVKICVLWPVDAFFDLAYLGRWYDQRTMVCMSLRRSAEGTGSAAIPASGSKKP